MYIALNTQRLTQSLQKIFTNYKIKEIQQEKQKEDVIKKLDEIKKVNVKPKETSEDDSSGNEYSVSPKNEFAKVEERESRYQMSRDFLLEMRAKRPYYQ